MPRATLAPTSLANTIVAGSRQNFGYLHENGYTISSIGTGRLNFYLKLTTDRSDLRAQCMAGLLRSIWRARASVIIDLGNNS